MIPDTERDNACRDGSCDSYSRLLESNRYTGYLISNDKIFAWGQNVLN